MRLKCEYSCSLLSWVVIDCLSFHFADIMIQTLVLLNQPVRWLESPNESGCRLTVVTRQITGRNSTYYLGSDVQNKSPLKHTKRSLHIAFMRDLSLTSLVTPRFRPSPDFIYSRTGCCRFKSSPGGDYIECRKVQAFGPDFCIKNSA
jgi:hypothetical protein